MFAFRHQNTIKRKVAVSGFGFWSGLDATVEFRPAPPDHGIVFVRRDLPGMPSIPALITGRTPSQRRTTLTADGTAVDMVEHVLAALAGLQIDNCLICVDRAEMPGCDGSSKCFVDALLAAGIQRQNRKRAKIVIEAPIRVGDDQSWIVAEPNPLGNCRLEYLLNYDHEPAIGQQQHSAVVGATNFQMETAPARTFLTQSEAVVLQRMGLGRRVRVSDILVFDNRGPIQNALRFENECARHKLLDMIGDFSLAGFDLVGNFTACRSGHRLNAELIAKLVQLKPVRPADESSPDTKAA